MTKQGREAGGIISILGAIYLIILNIIYIQAYIQSGFFIYTWIIVVLGILGGVLLLYDWTLGGGLSLTVGVILLSSCLMSLIFSGDQAGNFYLSLTAIGAGLTGLGGFIGLMIGSESYFSIGEPEIGLIDDWVEIKEMEILKTYNVEKIEFFDGLWGGLVFLVEFSKKINPESIKKLIEFLETHWNGKVFIMTKAGLDETELASDKYIIYQKEGGHLNYKIEQINLNE